MGAKGNRDKRGERAAYSVVFLIGGGALLAISKLKDYKDK